MARYDLPTLLALSQAANIDLDRFSDQAHGNNLLRPQGPNPNVLSECSVNLNRPRNVSGRSLVSEAAPGTLRPSSSRQGKALALTVDTQFDPGFMRFVKDHSSPKHQRVTAGGRIVPMNPTASPPKWNLALAGQAGASSYGTTTNLMSEGGYQDATGRPGAEHMVSPANMDMGRLPSLSSGVLANPGSLSMDGAFDQRPLGTAQRSNFQPPSSSSSSIRTTSKLNANAPPWPGPQQQHQPQQHQPQQHQPQQHQPQQHQPQQHQPQQHQPQQHIQSQPGSVLNDYMTYGLAGEALPQLQNSFQPMSAPAPIIPHMAPALQPQPVNGAFLGIHGYNAMNMAPNFLLGQYELGCEPGSSNIGSQWPRDISSQFPRVNQQSLSPQLQEAVYRKSLDDAQKHYDGLASQLSRLDRFTALHSWNIDLETKKLLVEQRKTLVRELDTVRLYKDHLQMLYRKFQVTATMLQREVATMPVHSPSVFSSGNSFMPDQNFPGNSMMFKNPGMTNWMPTNTQQQPFPTRDTGNSPSGPLQGMDSSASYQNAAWTGNPAMMYQPSTEADLSVIQRANSGFQAITPVKAITTNKADASAGSIGPSPNQLSPTVRNLYRKIEEAEKHGQPIDGLLKALSGASKGLAERLEERNKPVSSPSTVTVQETAGLMITANGGPGENSAAANKSVVKYFQPVQCSRRLWQSDDFPQNSRSHQRKRLFQMGRGDDSTYSSSLRSKTDSWATTHEEEKWWLDQELRSCRESQDKGKQSWTRERSQYHTASTNTPAAAACGVIEGRRQSMAPANAPMESSSVATNYAAANMAKEPTWPINRTPFSPLLRQCFSKDRSPVLQKTAAPAVSQNVTAHAYLPPFDGSGGAAGGFDLV